ncbi:MAG: Rieske (2Fe-2S) protein [Chloroflexi bacterium]|nr:Rieske (2Fe-2S) protein [Chloroflexota bacterium]
MRRPATQPYFVAKVSELGPGMRRVVEAGQRSILVLNVDGAFYAIRNRCPHQGCSLECGTVSGTMLPSDPQQLIYGRHNQILRCPWHGWELDLRTGRSLFDPEGVRVATYPVRIEGDSVVVEA